MLNGKGKVFAAKGKACVRIVQKLFHGVQFRVSKRRGHTGQTSAVPAHESPRPLVAERGEDFPDQITVKAEAAKLIPCLLNVHPALGNAVEPGHDFRKIPFAQPCDGLLHLLAYRSGTAAGFDTLQNLPTGGFVVLKLGLDPIFQGRRKSRGVCLLAGHARFEETPGGNKLDLDAGGSAQGVETFGAGVEGVQERVAQGFVGLKSRGCRAVQTGFER